MKARAFVVAMVLVGSIAGWMATGASGDPNPNTTGQPHQQCLSTSATTTPGNSSSSPGAPFNESSGTGGAAYNAGNARSPNSTNAVSQYDVACYQVSH